MTRSVLSESAGTVTSIGQSDSRSSDHPSEVILAAFGSTCLAYCPTKERILPLTAAG